MISWIFRFKENKLLLQFKKEIKEGYAVGAYYSYGGACCSRCDFSTSKGSFSTTLDPKCFPFGYHEVISWRVDNTEGLDEVWIGIKMHDWLQRNKNKFSVNRHSYKLSKEYTAKKRAGTINEFEEELAESRRGLSDDRN